MYGHDPQTLIYFESTKSSTAFRRKHFEENKEGEQI